MKSSPERKRSDINRNAKYNFGTFVTEGVPQLSRAARRKIDRLEHGAAVALFPFLVGAVRFELHHAALGEGRYLPPCGIVTSLPCFKRKRGAAGKNKRRVTITSVAIFQMRTANATVFGFHLREKVAVLKCAHVKKSIMRRFLRYSCLDLGCRQPHGDFLGRDRRVDSGLVVIDTKKGVEFRGVRLKEMHQAPKL